MTYQLNLNDIPLSVQETLYGLDSKTFPKQLKFTSDIDSAVLSITTKIQKVVL
jgi:hypothetical protein